MDRFILHSEYEPTGDQPEAIKELVKRETSSRLYLALPVPARLLLWLMSLRSLTDPPL